MKNDKRKMSLKTKIILTCVGVFAITVASIVGYGYYELNKIKTTKISKDNADLGIKLKDDNKDENKDNDNSINYSKIDEDILNIALFGIDSGRNPEDPPHSDCIIVATVDQRSKKIKLSSILRDTYVSVHDHGKTKINEAYTYGGPQLALRTLNENFHLNIRDYVTVDFFTLEKVIDTLGGIDVTIKDYEVDEINKWIDELSELEKKAPKHITNEGLQHLTGLQSVAYCRMRKVGNGDFERSDRQRFVLNQLIDKVSKAGFTKYPQIVSELLPLIETSLDKNNILKIGYTVVSSGITTIEQQRFPLDGYCKGELVNEKWFLVPKPDLDITVKHIHDYIYDDKKTEPKQPLF